MCTTKFHNENMLMSPEPGLRNRTLVFPADPPVPLSVTNSPQPPAVTVILSSTSVYFVLYLNGVKQNLRFCVLFLLLNIMFVRFVCEYASIYLPILYLINMWVVSRLGSMNNAVMANCVHVSR